MPSPVPSGLPEFINRLDTLLGQTKRAVGTGLSSIKKAADPYLEQWAQAHKSGDINLPAPARDLNLAAKEKMFQEIDKGRRDMIGGKRIADKDIDVTERLAALFNDERVMTQDNGAPIDSNMHTVNEHELLISKIEDFITQILGAKYGKQKNIQRDRMPGFTELQAEHPDDPTQVPRSYMIPRQGRYYVPGEGMRGY